MRLKWIMQAHLFLCGFFIANLMNSLLLTSLPGESSRHPADDFSRFNTARAKNDHINTSLLSVVVETPVVIISSLRPIYLEKSMRSIDDQHPNTPKWMRNSSRYLFIHRHIKNDNKDSYERVLELSKTHNYTVVEFQGLYKQNLALNVNANIIWYRMMGHLFRKLNVHEALIVEEDVILAPDALMVAARLLKEKRRRTDVHYIALGRAIEMNMINPDPKTFLALRPEFFQAMAYSLDSILFRHLEERKKQHLMDRPIENHVADWTEEITRSSFIENLTVMMPSVSRMHHIGAVGMGANGKGNQKRNISEHRAWDYWQQTLVQPNRTSYDMYLEPKSVTDLFGFICHPLRTICSTPYVNEWKNSKRVNLPNSFPRVPQTTHMMPAGTKLGPQLQIVHADSSTVTNKESPPSLAVDGNMYTRWGGKYHKKENAWIRVDVGSPSNISSISIHWENAFATKYNIQTSMDLKTFVTVQTVEDGEGMEDFFAFQETLPFARYIQVNCEEPFHSLWGYSIWEIIVRGVK